MLFALRRLEVHRARESPRIVHRPGVSQVRYHDHDNDGDGGGDGDDRDHNDDFGASFPRPVLMTIILEMMMITMLGVYWKVKVVLKMDGNKWQTWKE